MEKTVVVRQTEHKGYSGFLWRFSRWQTSQKGLPPYLEAVFEDFRMCERTHPSWVGESVLWFSRVGDLKVEKNPIALFRFAFTESDKGSVFIPLEALRLYFVAKVVRQIPASNRLFLNQEFILTTKSIYDSLLLAGYKPEEALPIILALINSWSEEKMAVGPTIPGCKLNYYRFGSTACRMFKQEKKIDESQLMAIGEELQEVQTYMNLL